MRLTVENFLEEIERFKDCVILVEGRTDVASLKSLGFEEVFAIHAIHTSVPERVEEIVLRLGRKKTFCVLTDFDDAGRKLHARVRCILSELGVNVDLRFRQIIHEAGVSHIQGLYTFLHADH